MSKETQIYLMRMTLILLGVLIFIGSMATLVWFNINYGMNQAVTKTVNDGIIIGTMFGMIWGAILSSLGIAYHKFF